MELYFPQCRLFGPSHRHMMVAARRVAVAVFLVACLAIPATADVRHCSEGCCCKNGGNIRDRTPRCTCFCVGAYVAPLCEWREVDLGRVRIVFANTTAQPFEAIDRKLSGIKQHYNLSETSSDVQRVLRVTGAEPADKSEIHYMMAFRGLLAEAFLTDAVSVEDTTSAYAQHGRVPAAWQANIGILKAWVFETVDAPAGPYASHYSMGEIALGDGVTIPFPLAALEWLFGPIAAAFLFFLVEYVAGHCGFCRKAWVMPDDPNDLITDCDVSLDQDDYTEAELRQLEMDAGITPSAHPKTPQTRANPMKPPH